MNPEKEQNNPLRMAFNREARTRSIIFKWQLQLASQGFTKKQIDRYISMKWSYGRRYR